VDSDERRCALGPSHPLLAAARDLLAGGRPAGTPSPATRPLEPAHEPLPFDGGRTAAGHLPLAQNLTVTLDSGGGTLAAAGSQQTQTTSVPAGPLATTGALTASAGGATNNGLSYFSWVRSGSETQYDVNLNADCYSSGTGSASVAPIDIVVLVSHPTPTSIAFGATVFSAATTGAATPTRAIDVLDDGSFELTELTQQTLETVVQVGPTPVPIRCRPGLDLSVPGSTQLQFSMTLRPAETLVQVIASGCATAPYYVTPRFDGGVDYGTSNVLAGSMFAVFGLQTQPVYLGNYAWPNSPVVLPCSLVPSPDLVTFLSPTSFEQTLPIPAAVRPITLFSQGVWLAPGAITTTETSVISAY
jgi:hypothetical protein